VYGTLLEVLRSTEHHIVFGWDVKHSALARPRMMASNVAISFSTQVTPGCSLSATTQNPHKETTVGHIG
jgi:hypothetical protein